MEFMMNPTISTAPSVATVKPDAQLSTNFLQHHKIFCILCSTTTHNTITCPEAPPAKLNRIAELHLCKLCLDPAHNVKSCSHRDIKCGECGMQHLEYIFHKPDDWRSKMEVSVDRHLMQKKSALSNHHHFNKRT